MTPIAILIPVKNSLRLRKVSLIQSNLYHELQVRTYAHPQRAYANEPSFSILKSIKAMEARLQMLEEKIRGQEWIAIRDEITILRPLRDTAVGMRKEFFATFLRDQQSDTIGNPAAVREGDQIAHVGDVVTDICIIKNGLMDYKEAFRALYGLNWQMAQELIGTYIYFYQSPLPTALSNTFITLPLVHPHIVEVMNIRATTLSGKGAVWTQEAEFDQLIHWTRQATPKDLREFARDSIGNTEGKRLYLRLKHKRWRGSKERGML